MRVLAGSRVRYGYRRLTVLLKREGWQVNAKRIYRLYIEEGLIVRTQKRRERAQRQRVPLGQAVRPNQKWSMDFVAQRLPDGRWIRVLTVVDQFTRECLTLFADNSLSGEKVATALDKVSLCGPLQSRSPSTTGPSSQAAGYNQFRHPVQRYAATELIAERGCQKYHPRRRRAREIRTC
jgi:putative transposase